MPSCASTSASERLDVFDRVTEPEDAQALQIDLVEPLRQVGDGVRDPCVEDADTGESARVLREHVT